ncbi:hypothetical protein EDB89DRAFT_2240066 [Lactarius sanguifluus]|nr:hypothetical protein EDB89DRAFT_2240066 [Lactarius sanguifluus]
MTESQVGLALPLPMMSSPQPTVTIVVTLTPRCALCLAAHCASPRRLVPEPSVYPASPTPSRLSTRAPKTQAFPSLSRISAPTNKNPKYEEEEDGEEALTLHALSVIALVRLKVNITLYAFSLRLTHATMHPRMLRVRSAHTFVLPTLDSLALHFLPGDTPMPTSRRLPRSGRATTTTTVLVLAAGEGAGRGAAKGKVHGSSWLAWFPRQARPAPRSLLLYSTVTPTSISTSALSPSSLRALPPRLSPLFSLHLYPTLVQIEPGGSPPPALLPSTRNEQTREEDEFEYQLLILGFLRSESRIISSGILNKRLVLLLLVSSNKVVFACDRKSSTASLWLPSVWMNILPHRRKFVVQVNTELGSRNKHGYKKNIPRREELLRLGLQIRNAVVEATLLIYRLRDHDAPRVIWDTATSLFHLLALSSDRTFRGQSLTKVAQFDATQLQGFGPKKIARIDYVFEQLYHIGVAGIAPHAATASSASASTSLTAMTSVPAVTVRPSSTAVATAAQADERAWWGLRHGARSQLPLSKTHPGARRCAIGTCARSRGARYEVLYVEWSLVGDGNGNGSVL